MAVTQPFPAENTDPWFDDLSDWAEDVETNINGLPAQIKTTLLDGLSISVVTQTEYNNIPLPRPTDVLYVIKP